MPDAHLARVDVGQRERAWRQNLADPGHFVFVAEVADSIVGFADAGPNREAMPPYDGELYAIYLAAGVHRRGIGRLLVHSAAEALGTAGFRAMVVWVLERNPACRFYEALGGLRLPQAKTHIASGVSLEEVAYGWPSISVLF
jgi:GNAT superfamily N-acetyltransferase